MSTALQLIKPEQQRGMELQDLMTLGDVFKASGYFRDVRDQAQAVVKILYGQELGFSPVISMMGIHVIEGKPALSANLMGAMVKRSGKYNYTVGSLTDTECVLKFSESGKQVGESRFSMTDAKRAGVVKTGSGWEKYPRNMMFARALSNGVKLFCPELSACPIYVPEELGAVVDEEGAVVDLPKSAKPVATIEKDVVIGEEPQDSTPKSNALWTADLGGPVEENVPDIEYSNKEQQDYLVLRFKDSLPQKLKSKADELRREWLKEHGYHENGTGTSRRIPRAIFPEVCKDAVKYAKSLKEE